MKKIILVLALVGFGLLMTGCEKKKTTDEQLEKNTAKEAKPIKSLFLKKQTMP